VFIFSVFTDSNKTIIDQQFLINTDLFINKKMNCQKFGLIAYEY